MRAPCIKHHGYIGQVFFLIVGDNVILKSGFLNAFSHPLYRESPVGPGIMEQKVFHGAARFIESPLAHEIILLTGDPYAFA